jgi:two-component system sensor histidine kinase CpxA
MTSFALHRLFWKIFLSFWISLVLFAGASLLTASLFVEHARSGDAQSSPRARLRSHLDEARRIADGAGVEGLRVWLRQLDRREVIPLLLIDADGEDLLGRTVPGHLPQFIGRREQRPHPGPFGPPRRGRVVVADGQEYRLVPDFRAVTLNRVLSRPRVIAIPLIMAAVVSALVCVFLARYLTGPIRRLSLASRQFAGGDLATRVGPTMGHRKDEVAELAHDFDHMAERLQTQIDAQRQLLSDVSHELRSPLARLQVALGLARQRRPDRPMPELDRIEREAERLNELIGQLLSLARLESGNGTPDVQPVDLVELLHDIAEGADFEARARDRQVRVTHDSPAAIHADVSLLRSALENVVRNAVRYTAENTAVTITVGHADEGDGRVRIRVRDHGPGVPQDRIGRLFKPFVRAGEARDRQSGGYGLGLAIAERAIRLHGGTITARNLTEGGFEVIIELPVDAALPSAQPPREP